MVRAVNNNPVACRRLRTWICVSAGGQFQASLDATPVEFPTRLYGEQNLELLDQAAGIPMGLGRRQGLNVCVVRSIEWDPRPDRGHWTSAPYRDPYSSYDRSIISASGKAFQSPKPWRVAR